MTNFLVPMLYVGTRDFRRSTSMREENLAVERRRICETASGILHKLGAWERGNRHFPFLSSLFSLLFSLFRLPPTGR